jgi:hypothetical protein
MGLAHLSRPVPVTNFSAMSGTAAHADDRNTSFLSRNEVVLMVAALVVSVIAFQTPLASSGGQVSLAEDRWFNSIRPKAAKSQQRPCSAVPAASFLFSLRHVRDELIHPPHAPGENIGVPYDVKRPRNPLDVRKPRRR